MVGVQGSADPNRELLDAQALVGHLVPAGTVHAFLAEHRQRLFPDEFFADLFPSGRGRPCGYSAWDTSPHARAVARASSSSSQNTARD